MYQLSFAVLPACVLRHLTVALASMIRQRTPSQRRAEIRVLTHRTPPHRYYNNTAVILAMIPSKQQPSVRIQR